MQYDDWNERIEGEDGDDCDYRRTPSFCSTADPDRLQKIFDRATLDGWAYRMKHGKLAKGDLDDMLKTIQDAKAVARTCNPLFKTINGEAE